MGEKALAEVTTKDGRTMDVVVKSFTPIGLAKSSGATGSNIADPFDKKYGDNIIPPPYNPMSLAQIEEISDLGPAIEAMATNIDGFGHEFVEPEWRKGANKDDPAAQKEKERLKRFFNYCNSDQNFTMLRMELRHDLEGTTGAFMEVVRDMKGDPSELYRLPAHTVRITKQDDNWTRFTQRIRGEDGEYHEVTRRKKFRRYVQILNGNKKVYFKEFGDPRVISSYDGTVVSRSIRPATEVIMFKRPGGIGPYSIPRWIGQLIGIMGNRKAEEVNYLYFDNKGIPPAAIMVSGGSLTKQSLEVIKDLYERELKGVANFHRVLILEAIPHSASAIAGEKMSPVRIEIQPLTHFQEKDALFREYRKDNADNLRASFRLAPLYVGKSTDYTRATAKESTRVMEEQVFEPERRIFDYIINRTLLTDLEIKCWLFRSLGAKTSDDAAIVDAMSKVQNALPVGVIIEAVASLRNEPIGDIPEEYYKMTLGQLLASDSLPASETDEGQDEGQKVVKTLIEFRKSLIQHIEKAEAS